MPITLLPVSRRRFLAGSLAAGAGLAAGGRLPAAEGKEEKADPDRFALLADTHVSGNREQVVRETNMFKNLKQVGGELLSLERRPAAAIINGDCAYLSGKSEDYTALVELLAPVREGGLPVHLTLGNHDHRPRFWKAIPATAGQDKAVMDRHLTLVRSPRANWFLLDSLDVTNRTPGTLGEQQLAWLAKSLDAHADKPALVVGHHNPDDDGPITGLTDTKQLRELLAARKHVKAYLFGHTHDWAVRQREGVYEINLPPVAYVFARGKANGWVDVRLTDTGATLELRTIDPKHAQHGEKHELKWRG